MRLGLGIGLGARDATVNPVLLSVNLALLALGDTSAAAFLSVTGLSFARASDGCTVQSGAAAVISALTGNDRPRIGSDGTHAGLCLSATSTNYAVYSNATSHWTLQAGATAADNAAVGPDGNSNAGLLDLTGTYVSGGGYVQASSGNPTGVVSVKEAWLRAASGTAVVTICDPAATVGTPSFSLTTTWQRCSLIENASSGTAGVWVRKTSGGQVYVWGAAIGQPGIADDPILTAGAPVTRAGERLYSASGSPLLSAGRLGLELVFAPKGARSAYSANCELWHDPATGNEAFVDPATGKVSVTIGGTTYTTASGVTWAANDAVKLWLEAGGGSLNTVAKASVNGAVTTLGTSGSPQGSLSVAGELDLACSGTTKQLTSRIASIAAYNSGFRPAWAA